MKPSICVCCGKSIVQAEGTELQNPNTCEPCSLLVTVETEPIAAEVMGDEGHMPEGVSGGEAIAEAAASGASALGGKSRGFRR